MRSIRRSFWGLVLAGASGFLSGCAPEATDEAAPAPAETAAGPVAASPGVTRNEARNAYFGDLHVHTTLSFDAFVFGTRTTPDDAYRFAKGEAIEHPAGFEMQLRSPLDFEAVTDHAAYLGMLEEMSDPATPAGQHPLGRLVQAARTVDERRAVFQQLGDYTRGLKPADGLLDPTVMRSAWQRIIDAAERHNEPGTFTTFIGYEYTASGEERQNLHRNVIFRGSEAADIPYSRLDSNNPEDLWRWMDGLRERGIESLAIPHNANGSDGMMFEMTDQAGNPIDRAYAELRLRNEPLVEITQVKGTSDTHPLLSANDEWADFEIFPYRIATTLPSRPSGSYVREAYLHGLQIQARTGANPYQFGLAGASDTHVAAGSFSEFDYWSKVGELDGSGDLRGSVPRADGTYSDAYYRFWSASGLTGVWAEANTREDIYAAFRRKETFATTGPRIQVRLFAGYDLPAGTDDASVLYAAGTPMGGELLANGGQAPLFRAWALRDPQGAPLQRLQIVKGWLEGAEPREQVFDVACSDAGQVDPVTHRCPDNGATVDLGDCSISAEAGAGELRAAWQDPDFDPAAPAFYYVRVLENPTCRWSTWDALRADVAPRSDLPATIQERAWSSPIWYRP
ncbi:MAG TPA: DUF3604 domain-containing protein [Pseudomonadales bacterium]